ncbi:MAG: IclR family transcriptional regulator C-terminal domain-containing protein [Alphaproteobacteria bacterium]
MATSRRTVGVESARKVLQLLLSFDAARPRAAVGDLARAAGLPLSSAYRLLALLREQGLVEEAGGGRYRVTPRVHALARAADAASPLMAAAQPVLARLAAETGATAVLFRIFGDVAMPVAAVEPRRPAHLSGVSGRSFPLHTGAPCKLLLAALPATLRAAYLDRIERADPAQRALRREREAELALIRKRGYAESFGEVDPGIYAIAAPVVVRRRTIASVWAALPARRIDPARRAALREATRAAGHALSKRLSVPPDPGQAARARY